MCLREGLIIFFFFFHFIYFLFIYLLYFFVTGGSSREGGHEKLTVKKQEVSRCPNYECVFVFWWEEDLKICYSFVQYS